MRKSPLSAALVAAGLLVSAACGTDDDQDQTTQEQTTPDPTESDDASETEPAAEVDDDVAATIDGEAVPLATVDDRLDELAEEPIFAEQLDGPQGDAILTQVRAQITSSVILAEVATDGAESLDRPVSDEDVARVRSEIEEQVGGAEQLEAALLQQGITASMLDIELRSLAALRNIEQALDEDAGDAPPDDTAPPSTVPGQPQLTPSEQRAQDFLVERLQGTDVVVNPEIGTWDATSGQVTPPGAGADGSTDGG